jgi:hypothetical protein
MLPNSCRRLPGGRNHVACEEFGQHIRIDLVCLASALRDDSQLASVGQYDFRSSFSSECCEPFVTNRGFNRDFTRCVRLEKFFNSVDFATHDSLPFDNVDGLPICFDNAKRDTFLVEVCSDVTHGNFLLWR